MKRFSRYMALAITAAALFFAPVLKAASPPDEGMWLPMFVERLNYTDMQKMGLKLTAAEMYSINNSSLKDAIVGLAGGSAPSGYFCTGEIVSDQGLLFTNHHCGFNSIQELSTMDHDYLTNGFWAMKLDEELPAQGVTASFLYRMEDVTAKIMEHLSDTMSEDSRSAKINELSHKFQKEASEDGKYDCIVKSFFGGNEFYLFAYLTYKDVRLVGTPPSSIGKFGGDTDNWMWPRHTGDFSIFRVYSAPDGSPAEYSKDNVPMKPKHFLPVSVKGVQKDDYAMIWGYPGSTDRYLTSYGVDQAINMSNPSTVKIRDLKLKIMKEDMNADPKVNLMYAAKHAGTANYWKYFIGQTRGLKRLNILDKKKAQEDSFMNWVNESSERQAKYGETMNLISQAYAEQSKSVVPLTYLNEALFQGPELILFAVRSLSIKSALEKLEKADKKDKEAAQKAVDAAIARFKKRADDFYKDFNVSTDQKLFEGLIAMYLNDVPAEMQPEAFRELNKKFKGDVKRMAEKLYSKSFYATPERLDAFFNKPSSKKMAKDPMFDLAATVRAFAMELYGMQGSSESDLEKGNRLYIAGLREMNPEKVYGPDANSTMRLSYGKVLDYYPADAMHYDYITTLSGVMEKEDPQNMEFVVDPKLKALYEKKDFGRYGTNINGKMDVVTCFLTTNDITGGNSGSPVINADGHLIGLAFDGNWEAMSGDIAFEPELQRTICVDTRYVLFIIEKLGECHRLIEEMNVVE
ncbi:MAG: S46 family peptidase [Bacteroidales bacterium]|nr:S46 family peptidase [Bacteroidales bacterium]